MNLQILKLKTIGSCILAIAAFSTVSFAQSATTLNNLYCGGFVQSSPINTTNFIVGAEFEADGHIFAQGDKLVIKGNNFRVGDMLSVVRPKRQSRNPLDEKRQSRLFCSGTRRD